MHPSPSAFSTRRFSNIFTLSLTTTRTMSATDACLPWKIVPWVSKKYPVHDVQWNWRQGPPLG